MSFTRSAEDVAAVYELAAAPLPEARRDRFVLDVVPLFETGEDLSATPDVLEGIIAQPEARRGSPETGRRMEIMLGYSDSAKHLGPTSATLRCTTPRTRSPLGQPARRHADPVPRPGRLARPRRRPAEPGVLAQAPGSVAGRFKVTEQGEVIFARYGAPGDRPRGTSSRLPTPSCSPRPRGGGPGPEAAARFAGLATVLDVAAQQRLPRPGGGRRFLRLVRAGHPLEEIAELRLGSRPAAAACPRRLLEDLRAIPWVFAWTQTRVNLPGWYGLGSGLEAAAGDLTAASRAYRIVAAVRRSARQRRDEPGQDRPGHRRTATWRSAAGRDLTGQVLAEYARTRAPGPGGDRAHSAARKPPGPLPRGALRNPYVDALSHLQLRALRAPREGTKDDTEMRRLLQITVNGVAAGLQNTG